MTRDELLKTAGELINGGGVPYHADEFQGRMLHAIACILLAKEMREGESYDAAIESAKLRARMRDDLNPF